jgi:hypothetical protein
MLKRYKDDCASVLAAIERARDFEPIEVVAFLEGTLRRIHRPTLIERMGLREFDPTFLRAEPVA